MKQKPQTILIVGAGSIGMRHANILAKLGKRVVMCDPDTAKHAPYGNLDKALHEEKPSVVFICTPTDLHLWAARKSLNANADVFIEKPIAHSLVGVDSLIKEARRRKRVSMVACNFRFHPGWLHLKRSLLKSSYGKPLLIRSLSGYYLPDARPGIDYKGGGVILDSGSHVIDYLLDLGGDITKGVLFKGILRPLGVAGEESAAFLLQHKGGVQSMASMDYFSRKPYHRLEVVTTKGSFTLDFRNDSLVFEDHARKEVLYRGDKNSNAMYTNELKHFLRCVQYRTKPLQDLRRAKEVLRVLLSLRSKEYIKNYA